MPTLSEGQWLTRMENECRKLKLEGFEVETSEVYRRLVLTIKASGFEPFFAGNIPSKRSIHKVLIVVPRNYPFVFPVTRWLTPIFHPNIVPPPPNGNGQIDTEILNIGNMRNLTELARRIVFLIENPNPAGPMPHPTCLEAKKFFERHPNKIMRTEGPRIIRSDLDTNMGPGPRIIPEIRNSPKIVGWDF